MTPLQQRLAIGSALGHAWWWERADGVQSKPRWIARFALPLEAPVGFEPHRGTPHERRFMTLNEIAAVVAGGSFICCCPDYPGSLNAMFDAEEHLTDAEWDWYIRALQRHTAHDKTQSYGIHTRSEVRAEAWLRVTGLWVDAPTEVVNPVPAP